MEKPVKPPLEQLRDISDTMTADWEFVVAVLKEATLEFLTDITDKERQMLELNFWSTHASLLERAELYQPGITKAIFMRFEEIGEERRKIDLG